MVQRQPHAAQPLRGGAAVHYESCGQLTSFSPGSGETTTISDTLAGDTSASLTVTVKVYDSANALVRTVVNGSQTVGAKTVVWDGKSDAGVVQPDAAYTVRVNATDGQGLAARADRHRDHHGRAAARLGYQYDRLYRLTGVTAPSGPTTYRYDPVGNRSSMTRGATTTGYAYDRADRITTAGTVSYTVNANGNTVARGTDSFLYDQANRLKSATIGGATSTYTYDGDGKRTSRTPAGGSAVNYAYDVFRPLPVLLDDGTRK